MFFNNPLDLLVECAGTDLTNSTELALKESTVAETYKSIKEASEPVIYPPQAVPVIKLDGFYVTEMNFLAPFIKSNEIKSISEALDHLAKVNKLDVKVGLLIESSDELDDILEGASKTKKSKTLDKFIKGGELINKLKVKGHPILKKQKTSKKK